MIQIVDAIWTRFLRDWFAGQALAGLAANGSGPPNEHDARLAYELADAMLLARKGEPAHLDKPARLRVATF